MTELVCPACGARLPSQSALRGVDRLHGTPGTFEVILCGSCGSGRTLPFVPAARLHELYPADYNAYRLPANPLLRVLATLLFRTRYGRALRKPPLEALRARPEGRLLDVGSGRGDLGVILKPRGWAVTGLEPSAEACEEAIRRGVPTVCGTLATDGDRLGGGFDAVVFNHSLEHVVEPLEDAGSAHGLLRDGGLILVSVPNLDSWQRRRFGSHWFHLDLPRHRSHFSPAGLESLLGRAGFGNISLATSTSADGLPMSMQYRLFGRRRFDRGVGRYAVAAATLAMIPAAVAADRIAGGGDVLHAVALKRSG